jgi:hypothetical protein
LGQTRVERTRHLHVIRDRVLASAPGPARRIPHRAKTETVFQIRAFSRACALGRRVAAFGLRAGLTIPGEKVDSASGLECHLTVIDADDLPAPAENQRNRESQHA